MPTLAALCDAGWRPALVVSQPSRPSGRGRRLAEPPVTRWARRHDLEVAQPADVRDPGFLRRIDSPRPRVAVVVAFGQIFPAALLQLPELGCVNLHASLLPRYRGAAPIAAAIIAGERRTGVTTMKMDEGLDTGPILLQESLEIGDEETAGELAERLARLGATLMVRTLRALEHGDLEPRPQRAAEASHAPRLRRVDGWIDWRQEAGGLFDRLRGLTPWPGLHTRFRRQPIKILWGRPVAGPTGDEEVGTYLGLRDERLLVRCGGRGVFGVETLQRSGRRALTGRQFANGERLEPGERFG